MPVPILAAKLYITAPRPGIVLRQRLTNRLNKDLTKGGKLTLVSAPAGFGKTTLISEWIAQCGRPTAWLSLDEGDNDLARFLTYLIAALFDFAIGFAVLMGLMAWYGFPLTAQAFNLLPIVGLLAAWVLAVSLVLAAVQVRFRDIGVALPVLLQVLMFASPIIYPVSFLPDKWQWILTLNPLTGIIENFRIAVFGNGNFDWKSLGVSTLITAVVLVYASFSFRRMERQFADIV